MAINCDIAYVSAREVSEPEFAKILNLKQKVKDPTTGNFFKIKKAYQGTMDDDVHHIDVIAELQNGTKIYFDVKDQLGDNRGKNTYSISKAEMDDVCENPDKYRNHYLALREYSYDNNFNLYPTGNYFILNSLESIQKNSKWIILNPNPPDPKIDSYLIDYKQFYEKTKHVYRFKQH